MAPAVSCLASIGGPGYSSIFLVDLFVPKIKLRERECLSIQTNSPSSDRDRQNNVSGVSVCEHVASIQYGSYLRHVDSFIKRSRPCVRNFPKTDQMIQTHDHDSTSLSPFQWESSRYQRWHAALRL